VVIFDYLFVHDDALIAVGSRQDTAAIELLRVSIGAQGQLTPASSRLVHVTRADVDGYRARLVAGALLLYFRDQPLISDPVTASQSLVYTLPALGDAAQRAPTRPLLRASDVHQPLAHTDETYLHTLVRCDLTARDFDCRARALAAPSATMLEFAEDALYLWIVAWRREGLPTTDSFLYRMPFDGTEPGAVRVRPPPHGRKDLLRATRGHLLASLSGTSRDQLALADIPSELFTTRAVSLPNSQVRLVRDLRPGPLERADVMLAGNTLLWGTRAWSIVGDLQPRLFLPTLEVVPLSGGSTRVAELGHAATHVAEVDDHALIIGSDKWNLHMSLLALSGEPRVLAKHVERDAARTLRRFGAVETLADVGDGHWFAAQIARETGGALEPAEALLPLHWTPGAAQLEALPDWSVPVATRPHFQPVGRELLGVTADLVLVRMQDQLLAVRFDPSPRIAQRIPLTGAAQPK
jgi:hypothetical protein